MAKDREKEIDEVREVFELQIKKLAILLQSSSLPNDVKEAWLNLLPKLTLSQMDDLLLMLEGRFLDEETRDVDKDFSKKMKLIMDDFKNDIKKVNEKYAKSFSNFEKQLSI